MDARGQEQKVQKFWAWKREFQSFPILEIHAAPRLTSLYFSAKKERRIGGFTIEFERGNDRRFAAAAARVSRGLEPRHAGFTFFNLGELGLWPVKLLAVQEHVDLLVVEAQVADDDGRLGCWTAREKASAR